MEALKIHKKAALAGALAVGLAAIGLLYAGNHKDGAPSVSLNGTNAPASTAHTQVGSPKILGGGLKNAQDRREWFEKEVKGNPAVFDSFATPADASAKLSFKLKYPKLEKLGRPIGVFVDRGDKQEDRVASIYYGDPGDGIAIRALILPKIDYDEQVVADEKYKKSGVLKADNTSFLVEVNGYKGSGWEPGYNVYVNFKQESRGSVEWQEDNGVVYTVFGTYGPDGTSVKELLEIARSMSE